MPQAKIKDNKMIYKVECIVGKWKKNPETKTVFLKENEIKEIRVNYEKGWGTNDQFDIILNEDKRIYISDYTGKPIVTNTIKMYSMKPVLGQIVMGKVY